MQKNALFNHGIVRYEVALGVVGAAISKCADQIGDALRQTPPDMETVTHLQAKQRELEVLRTAIDPFDAEKINSVIAQYGPLVRGEQIL
ncbi:hypothetical protein [Burkholderia cenocepacia]|uniref:hypothetical protein n=1 Tax=Burkholderia cenocepacia TaxID=95486 RepID=UPI002B245F72|nr:hypothetical protein [Burkholderia cenocepacia]MEB2500709.1 hypothetical protein [Burkholderia cenocepacia]MEB2558279.1 hypothetical protein [Burkholderia cenocepacia]